MVLKVILIFFCLSPLSSYSKVNLNYLFKLGEYEELLSEIEDIEEEKKLNLIKNKKLYEYKAVALERSGDTSDAIKIYKNLLNANYRHVNNKYMKAALKRKKINLNVKNKDELEYYYRKLSELYIKQFEKIHRGIERKNWRKFRTRAMVFSIMYGLVNDKTEIAESFLEKIKTHESYLNSFNYESNYYIYMSLISFQDNLELKKKNSSIEANVLNTTIGSCTGVGKRWKNDYDEINIHLCYLLASSSVYTSGGSLVYQADGIAVNGFYGGVDYLFSPANSDIAYGGTLDILSRSGAWEDPDDAEFLEKSYTRFGVSLKTKWSVGSYSFVISMGRIFKNESTLFFLSSQYNF